MKGKDKTPCTRRYPGLPHPPDGHNRTNKPMHPTPHPGVPTRSQPPSRTPINLSLLLCSVTNNSNITSRSLILRTLIHTIRPRDCSSLYTSRCIHHPSKAIPGGKILNKNEEKLQASTPIPYGRPEPLTNRRSHRSSNNYSRDCLLIPGRQPLHSLPWTMHSNLHHDSLMTRRSARSHIPRNAYHLRGARDKDRVHLIYPIRSYVFL